MRIGAFIKDFRAGLAFFQKKVEISVSSRVSSIFFPEENGRNMETTMKKDTKTQSIEVKSTNFIIYTTNSHKTHLE